MNKTESAKGVTGQTIAGPGSGISDIEANIAGEAVTVKRTDIINENLIKKFLALLMNTVIVVRTTVREELGHGQSFIDNVQPRLIMGANKNRLSATVRNIGGQNVYIGGQSVTVSNGFLIRPFESVSLDRTWGHVYGISDNVNGSNTCWIEE